MSVKVIPVRVKVEFDLVIHSDAANKLLFALLQREKCYAWVCRVLVLVWSVNRKYPVHVVVPACTPGKHKLAAKFIRTVRVLRVFVVPWVCNEIEGSIGF